MEKLNCKGKLVTKQEKKKEIEVMSKQMKPNTQVNKKKGASGITLIALIITMVLHYDKVKKCSNSNSFLLSSI